MRKNIKAKKHLGQHFLKDQFYLNKIIDHSQCANACVIEIGPGQGHLTEHLLKNYNNVLAIEKDKELECHLRNKFAKEIKNATFTLIINDALTWDFAQLPDPKVLIANLPYNISVPLIMQLLEHDAFQAQHILLQKEVAQRLCANHNTKSYGRISVLAQTFTNTQLHFHIPGSAFTPSTKVTSSFISLRSKPTSFNIDFVGFSHFLTQCFKHKRKMLRSFIDPKTINAFASIGIPLTMRAEQISVEQYQKCYLEYIKN